ncbi:hypothetical protein IAP91_16650 [Leuconostoc mesenteroides]|nr:hypothetical protein [Leuconostoc mesenteroides]
MIDNQSSYQSQLNGANTLIKVIISVSMIALIAINIILIRHNLKLTNMINIGIVVINYFIIDRIFQNWTNSLGSDRLSVSFTTVLIMLIFIIIIITSVINIIKNK